MSLVVLKTTPQKKVEAVVFWTGSNQYPAEQWDFKACAKYP